MKQTLILFSLLLATNANAQKIDSLQHGIPKARNMKIPKNSVRILDLPSQMYCYKTIQIYQNSLPDSIRMPFETYIDTLQIKKFIDFLERKKMLPSTPYRYCIHFPGLPTGSEIFCDNYYKERIVGLEWGREFYEHVYLPYGVQKNFYLLCEDQANLVFFHEAGHLLHCTSGVGKSKMQKEKEACTLEREWRKRFKNIFYFTEFKNAQWTKTMQYIEILRR